MTHDDKQWHFLVRRFTRDLLDSQEAWRPAARCPAESWRTRKYVYYVQLDVAARRRSVTGT